MSFCLEGSHLRQSGSLLYPQDLVHCPAHGTHPSNACRMNKRQSGWRSFPGPPPPTLEDGQDTILGPQVRRGRARQPPGPSTLSGQAALEPRTTRTGRTSRAIISHMHHMTHFTDEKLRCRRGNDQLKARGHQRQSWALSPCMTAGSLPSPNQAQRPAACPGPPSWRVVQQDVNAGFLDPGLSSGVWVQLPPLPPPGVS